jgi:hypothetical protein
MHARPPPANVSVFAYTPGIRASATVGGRGASQRAGRHARASGPHVSASRFTPGMFTKSVVPAGTKSSVRTTPRTSVYGCASGRTWSRLALRRGRDVTRYR